MPEPWTEAERELAEQAYAATRLAVSEAGQALSALPEAQRARLQLAAGPAGIRLATAGSRLQPESLPGEQDDATELVRYAYEFRQAFGDVAIPLRANATAEDRAALMDAGWRAAGQRLGDVEEHWRQIPGAVVFRVRGRRRRRKSGLGLLLGIGLGIMLLGSKKGR